MPEESFIIIMTYVRCPKKKYMWWNFRGWQMFLVLLN